ncbi:uncharacterized protein [Medicago truncatula]|uniref:Uncharacterized protein n=1 Tax=Medicago truncatula TaxID=3880 RepID=I3T8Y0_MEDTR|nr:uncharacterized protein LOC11406103 [Medicago truncatula]AFK48972.1 unknown [Medicago truncatula]
MIENLQISGRMLPTWWENQLKMLKGIMKSSKKMLGALSMVKLHSLTEQIMLITEAMVLNNKQKVLNPEFNKIEDSIIHS